MIPPPKKKIILTFISHYLPGYKAGGALRSIANLVAELGDSFFFKLVTSDRDMQDTVQYPNITVDKWNEVGKAEVFYNSSNLTYKKIKNIYNENLFDVIYLNSFFSFRFSILPLLVAKLRKLNNPIILAPRGEFYEGALKQKKFKKYLYLLIIRIFNFYNGVIFQASSEQEKETIEKFFKKKDIIRIATDIPTRYENIVINRPEKRPGELKIVFLSRITPKKNLIGAIEVLKKLGGKIEFDIYGDFAMHESRSYKKKCMEAVKRLPDNITVRFLGFLPHEEVVPTLTQYHVFLFPTLGENFGHVIWEAYYAGCFIITSRKTFVGEYHLELDDKIFLSDDRKEQMNYLKYLLNLELVFINHSNLENIVFLNTIIRKNHLVFTH